jgi:hypothetical protein
MDPIFPEFFQQFPDADIPFAGIRGKLLQIGDHQAVFLDVDTVGALPPHAHSAQWGIVVKGEVDLNIGGETRTYRQGDHYYIPAGVEHSATFRTHFQALEFFAEPNRYRPKSK